MANTKSIDFEVSNLQVLTISDANLSPTVTNDFSAEFWINIERLPSVVGGNFQVLNKYGATGWMVRLDASDKFSVYFKGSPSDSSRVSAGVVLSSGDIGNWIHFAVTVDVSQGAIGILLYKNGVLLSAVTNSNNGFSMINDGTALGIGGKASATQTVDGKVDEVILWSDIRTPTEIAESYNSGDGKEYNGNEAGMVGYWRMENDFADTTANGNDLTAVNSPLFSDDVPFGGEEAGIIMSVATADFALTGNDLAFLRTYNLTVETAEFIMTGFPILLKRLYSIAVETAEFALTFNPLATVSSSAYRKIYKLKQKARSFIIKMKG